ncbi:S-adenosyl-L-methionine-dependent methyltransferase [Artomyces pyxidatus]|uniref:S-adenosyl-L-methionine-dependent methyltransferase n=1 Tax=Artomyces pyxidatus TaxID=48021 RepID=A0ACB8SRJ7_9AGAM|nr:S-adenosyl-L-methionine-dependent methyltransferase [Artomyces pyxidatus]
MTSPLSALVSIISSGVEALESAYAGQGIAFPSLDEPFRPGPLDKDPGVVSATRLIVAAAHQIIATVRPPLEVVLECGSAMHMPAAIGLAVDVNVPDVLKDAGPEGVHVDEIGRKVDIDGERLARVLRYLATRHISKEVKPNVFTNNRPSSILVKTRPLEELKSNKMTKYDGAPLAAIIGHMTDDALRSSVYMGTYLKDAPHGVNAPFNLAWNTQASIWDWFEEPGNEWRGRRFINAMSGGGERFPPKIFIDGFDWKSLKDDSVVVDVGGSVGTVVLTLLKEFPHLKFVVEDLNKVIEERATKFWAEQDPQAILDGRVTLKVQDFFETQAVKQAAVYFLRLVIHDWSTPKSIQILKNLRDAASPTSKLVIFDSIMPYACADSDSAGPPPPPSPLLANLGVALGGFITSMDLGTMNLLNGQERSLSQFRALGKAAGWKLESVKPGMLAAFQFAVDTE